MIYNFPDLHMHSTFSDGSDSPALLLENVRKSGVDLFALTDHDSYGGCFEIEKNLKPDDPKFLRGIELSCQDSFGKYHVLGYCFDTNKDSLNKAIDITHNARFEKLRIRLEYLKLEYGFEFKKEDVDKLMAENNPGRPHIVNLMYEYGYIDDKQYGFDILAKCHGEERKLSPEEAVDAILSADGIPVLAHGVKGDGSKNYSYEQTETIVERLKGWGLMGVEGFYSKFNVEQTETMLSLAKKYNLLVTAGSDYHGTNKNIKIGETSNPDINMMTRFYKTVEMLLD